MEGQIAFATILRRLANLQLEPEPLVWRPHLALRGLTALHVRFGDAAVA
jgi:cytochrome P450